jgi:hypothetical protein
VPILRHSAYGPQGEGIQGSTSTCGSEKMINGILMGNDNSSILDKVVFSYPKIIYSFHYRIEY